MELFDQRYETYNDNARQLDAEVIKAIRPIIEEWHEKGCRLVDICSIVNDAVSLEACYIRSKIVSHEKD